MSNRFALRLNYQQASQIHANQVKLVGQLQGSAVNFNSIIKQPLLFRDTLASLFAVVNSDYRYVPKDRAAYVAFSQMRRGQQNAGLFKAQQAYFNWLFEHDPLAVCVLDPIMTVHPDKILFEVFSKDEGCYAQLSLSHQLFTTDSHTAYGTTHIDYSESLSQSIEQMRSFREARLHIGQDAVAVNVQTAAALPNSEVIEKQIQLPQSWLRGLLQVQSAAQLSQDKFCLAPIDIYNLLHHLRLHADMKGKRRGLLIELSPQQPIKLILEPNDTVIISQAPIYQGKQAKMIRLWGRRRLALLERVLAYAERIDVQLLGHGMPSYWTASGKDFSFTLAMTGFSQSNWSQAINFDLLLPRHHLAENHDSFKPLLTLLQQHYFLSLAEISQQLKLDSQTTLALLQQACQQGLVMFDGQSQVYRYRPVLPQGISIEQLRYRQPAEQQAYELVEQQGAIGDLEVMLLNNEGLELSATIHVAADKRSYLSKLKLNEEGMVAKAECSCHQIMQHGLSQGPCSHLLALRIAYAQQLSQQDRQILEQETRLFSRRRGQQLEQYQISFYKKRLFISNGLDQQRKRQQLAFNSIAAARQAYFNKIEQFQRSGFIDSTLG